MVLDKEKKYLYKENEASFFWMGELSFYEIANLNSFCKNNFKVNLWTYDKELESIGLSNQINVKDARLILDEEFLYKFNQGSQKSNMSSFSNIFRFELLSKYGGWWFDMDCICIKNVNSFINLAIENNFVIGRERKDYTGSSVLFFKEKDVLNNLIDTTWERINKNNYKFYWGEIGPDLITEIILEKNLMTETFDEKYFYKVSPGKFYKFFQNNNLDNNKLEQILADSYVAHTWNEMFNRYLIKKTKLPPKNSFLYQHIKSNIYDLSNIPTYSNFFNWRFLKYINFFIRAIFRIKIYIKNVS